MKQFYSILLILLVTSSEIKSQTSNNNLINWNNYSKNVLYVKFQDDCGLQANDKKLVGRNGNSFQVVPENLGYWKRAHSVSVEKLSEYRQRAERNLKKKMYDPNSEFHFYVDDPTKILEVKQLLSRNPLVERVLLIPVLFNASAPDYMSYQGYLTSAVAGINAEAVWSTYNNRGAGIKFCDVEYDFNSNHSDLKNITIVGPTPVDPFASGAGIKHGTAVLGEVVSKDDGIGTTGIAGDCDAYFSSSYIDSVWDITGALTNAMSVLSAGDVLLIEQQMAGPNYDASNASSQIGLVAVEWYLPWYQTIMLAVGQGITVVEAAGNGQQNFDDPIYSTDNGGHYPFLPENNSGAIIVGAGSNEKFSFSDDVPRSRLSFSNYGSRVDVQGIGQRIYTTGYGDLYAQSVDEEYTRLFGGTSSSSPMVAGATILLQSVYKKSTGKVLTPDEVKINLKTSGKLQVDGIYSVQDYHIGPLPDAYQAIQLALSSTGLSDLGTEQEISVFPNPTHGIFNISLSDNSHIQEMKIINALGQEICHVSVPARTERFLSVNLLDQPKGIYFVQLKTEEKIVTKKITFD